ncbi:plastocyanin/azurin family copper-binding protein [Microvirga puerhi]|uniref:Blue (type 1) copper domain-containing protein n=1 Tax=Microvirga puerhi TaxID=2876078 RepID=A0ABS7VL11_9HYPH|nr:plastocyanin/azurin family copper-binding protein [Microvirga puerhi]MBZ6076221.1 hypothetical protein [Microvirga puerhi]
MILSRRHVLWSGMALLALPRSAGPAWADDEGPIDIVMHGNVDGSHVWFDPVGIAILPGRTVRWTNRDPGNAHTATSYHPDNFQHPLRIPKDATPWNSDYLLPDESFSVVLAVEGVYDYFCIPHEHAGMVGRIVVGRPGSIPKENVSSAQPQGTKPIPEAAAHGFPSVEEIVQQGTIRRT